MSCYPTLQDVMDLGILLEEDVRWLEERYSGIVLRISTKVSGTFDDFLSKRYGTPFQAPYPDSLIDNVAAVVTYRLLVKRGAKPEGTKLEAAEKARDEAMAWLVNAADSKDGLVELVRAQSTPRGAVAVDRGGTLAYSEASPYSWMDVQRDRITSGEP